MVLPNLDGDVLPLGRHAVELSDLVTAFVESPDFKESRSRRVIWEHFTTANDLLQSVVTVHSAWIGGSFTTSKLNPRDIDVVYVVNAEDRASRTAKERRVIDAFVRRVKDPVSGRTVPEHGLLVDSFLLDWSAHLPPRSTNADYQGYAELRGYWDDWWTRQRNGKKTDAPTRLDALPARGYLEVQFSAFA